MKKLVLAVGAISAGLAFAETTPTIRYFDDGGLVEPEGDKLTFGSGGVIEYQGDVELPYTVEASADLTIRLSSEGETVRKYLGGVLFTPYSNAEAEPVKIFENMDLDEWEPLFTIFDYNNHPLVVNISGPGAAHFIRRETLKDGRKCLYAQMQTANFFQCVKIILIQDGTDVLAQTVYVRYDGKATEADGQVDYDKSSSGYKSYNVAALPNASGYGVNHLYMRKVDAAEQTLAVTKNLMAAGSLAIADGASVGAYGPDAMTSETIYGQALVLDGGLTFVERNRDIDFRGVIVGTNGTLKVVRDPAAERVETTISAADLENTGLTTTWITLKENARLSSVIGVASKIGGSNISSTPQPAMAYGFRNDGLTASVLIEKLPSCTQAVRIVLRQNGDNIEIRSDAAWYLGAGNYPDGYDFTSNNSNTNPDYHSWTVGPNNYQAKEWTVFFGEECAVSFGSELKRLYNATVEVGGLPERRGILRLEELYTVPEVGALRAGPCVDVKLANKTISGKDFSEFNSSLGAIEITGNSTLTTASVNPFSTWNSGLVAFDESVFYMNASYRAYINNLQLSNGSLVRRYGATDANMSAGWQSEAKWRITGNSPSTVDVASLPVLGGATSDSRPFRLTVDDVTGNSDPDFTLTGNIVDSNGFLCHHVYKSGAGTILHLGTVRHAYSPLHLQEGTWLVGRSDAFLDGTGITYAGLTGISLEGGTFAVAAATTNALPALPVTASSGIELGNGAELAFADSSAVAWMDGAKLTVTLGEGAKLRFGTSASALTAGQLAQINVNDRKAVIDEEGFVGPKPKLGITIIVR